MNRLDDRRPVVEEPATVEIEDSQQTGVLMRDPQCLGLLCQQPGGFNELRVIEPVASRAIQG